MWDPTESRVIYKFIHYGVRVYMACLGVAAVYSTLWAAQIAGYLERTTVGMIWVGIAAMGAVFLVILLPVFFTSRFAN